ncbi:hypothetical protein SPAR62_0799 [Streptococcus pneumoniae GA40028]|nr:hypothetical protein SPAR62_0799 [Streptococcus pneumoniae GA40028]
MNSLPNHHFQNKSFYQLSFDGGHLTQYGGLIFFQELFSQLKLKERISKYLVTNRPTPLLSLFGFRYPCPVPLSTVNRLWNGLCL